MKRFDKVKTKYGAGGLLEAGLIGTVLIVNGNDIFIRIGGNSWHTKKHELELIESFPVYINESIGEDDRDTEDNGTAVIGIG